MKIAKHIHTIICDDIREESENKVSLMGVYNKEIFVTDIPTILPTLCFMISFEGIKKSLKNFEILLFQDKTKSTLSKFDDFPEDISKINDLRLMAKLTPFRINKEGIVKIQMRDPETKKLIKIFEFKITNKAAID